MKELVINDPALPICLPRWWSETLVLVLIGGALPRPLVRPLAERLAPVRARLAALKKLRPAAIAPAAGSAHDPYPLFDIFSLNISNSYFLAKFSMRS